MLRWLVIGVGDITTRRVLPGILAEPHSVLAGIVTRTPSKAEPYSVPVWTELDRALAECTCEAVYVASPVFLHSPHTLAALSAGKHVLCEKPVGMNYAEARSLVDAARAANRVFGVAYYRRTYPKVRRAKELIQADAIGRPVLAEAWAHDWFFPADDHRSWLIDPRKAGGGPLFDIGSHRIDLMNFLFGKPVRATGQMSTQVQPTEVEDNATALIEYDSGVRAMVDVRWHSRVNRDEFRIRGTDGEIELSPLNGPEIRHPGGVETLPTHTNIHYPLIEDYVRGVLDRTALSAPGSDCILTDWVTEQVVRADHNSLATRS